MSVQFAERNNTQGILSGPSQTDRIPEWFRDQKQSAWKQYQSLPTPTRKDQLWRFSNVGNLDLSRFISSSELTDQERGAILDQSRGVDDVAGRLIFAGDELVQR